MQHAAHGEQLIAEHSVHARTRGGCQRLRGESSTVPKTFAHCCPHTWPWLASDTGQLGGEARAACPRSARGNQESADSTESPVPLAATGSPLPSGRAAAAHALALSVSTRSLCLVSPGSAGDWLPSRGRTATLSRSPASSATLRAESPSSPRSGKFSEPPWELAAGEMSHH